MDSKNDFFIDQAINFKSYYREQKRLITVQKINFITKKQNTFLKLIEVSYEI